MKMVAKTKSLIKRRSLPKSIGSMHREVIAMKHPGIINVIVLMISTAGTTLRKGGVAFE